MDRRANIIRLIVLPGSRPVIDRGDHGEVVSDNSIEAKVREVMLQMEQEGDESDEETELPPAA